MHVSLLDDIQMAKQGAEVLSVFSSGYLRGRGHLCRMLADPSGPPESTLKCGAPFPHSQLRGTSCLGALSGESPSGLGPLGSAHSPQRGPRGQRLVVSEVVSEVGAAARGNVTEML